MIKEFTIEKREGMNGSVPFLYYILKLGENLYYVRNSKQGIDTTENEGFAARFGNEKDIDSLIIDLKKFFNEKGKYKIGNDIREEFENYLKDVLVTVHSNEVKEITGSSVSFENGEKVENSLTKDVKIFPKDEFFELVVGDIKKMIDYIENEKNASFFSGNKENLEGAIKEKLGLPNRQARMFDAYENLKSGRIFYEV